VLFRWDTRCLSHVRGEWSIKIRNFLMTSQHGYAIIVSNLSSNLGDFLADFWFSTNIIYWWNEVEFWFSSWVVPSLFIFSIRACANVWAAGCRKWFNLRWWFVIQGKGMACEVVFHWNQVRGENVFFVLEMKIVSGLCCDKVLDLDRVNLEPRQFIHISVGLASVTEIIIY